MLADNFFILYKGDKMLQEDTISAIATAIGEGGIGIVRMSGEKAFEIADKIFEAANKQKIINAKDRSITFGHILDSKKNIIDEAVILTMRSPKSYTKEDVIEIQCHGGILPLQKVLSRTLEAGARLAERGEFTKRAFLNGRLDLSQAQAVLDIIQAKTDSALKVAEDKLAGKITSKIYELRQEILQILAHIEVIIDFPEDNLENITLNEINNDIILSIDELNKILENETKGKILREGIETAIIGKPNVGKSSLLNFLLKTERAIVTDIPGTTRDSIEEYINIRGIPVKIIDTAGIHNSTDKIENIGIAKSKKYAEKAELILALFDSSSELDAEDEEIFNLIDENNTIILLTKSDLMQKLDMNKIRNRFPKISIIPISVKKQVGIEELEENIVEKINNVKNELQFIRDERELEILRQARKHLEDSLLTLKENISVDLISIDLRSALNNLDKLTGESVDEDVLNEIFSKFCIGK